MGRILFVCCTPCDVRTKQEYQFRNIHVLLYRCRYVLTTGYVVVPFAGATNFYFKIFFQPDPTADGADFLEPEPDPIGKHYVVLCTVLYSTVLQYYVRAERKNK